MSSKYNKDLMARLKESSAPKLGRIGPRAKPQGYQCSIVIQRTVTKPERKNMNVIDITKKGTKPINSADGTKPRTFADGTRPRSFADGTRPRSFANRTVQNYVAPGDIEIANAEPRSVGRQQNVNGVTEKMKVLRQDNGGQRPRFWNMYRDPSFAKFHKSVEDRSEFLRRHFSGQTIQEDEPNNSEMPPLAIESENDSEDDMPESSLNKFHKCVDNRVRSLRRHFSEPTTEECEPNNDSIPSFEDESDTEDLEEFIIIDRELISNIEEEDMDGIVFDWLYTLNIHKYFWFFKKLSFNEIKFVSEKNFYEFLDNMNKSKQCVSYPEMVKICKVTKCLRDRPLRLARIIKTLNVKSSVYELSKYVDYLKYILPYPVPNKNCATREENGAPQFEIFLIMQKICRRLMEHLENTKYLYGESLLVSVICKYTKCVKLIMRNQLFFEYQVNGVMKYAETLWSKIQGMKKDFN